jgi:GAF domain-containing protein
VSDADELARELGELASSLGPAVRPVGSDDVLRSITETARQLFGAAACSLALLSEDDSELVYTTAAGEGADSVTGIRMPASHGIAGWVAQSGQPIAVSDVSRDPRFSAGVAEQTGYVPTSILAVPVETSDRTLGVMSLLDRDARRPDAEHDMALLSLLADQAALVLASMDSFSALGRVLLRALAAASAGGELDEILRRAAESLPAADADLTALAAAFAALARRGTAERRLALAVLTDVAQYAGRRSPRARLDRHGAPPLPRRRSTRCRESTCRSTRTGLGAAPRAEGSPSPWWIAGLTHRIRQSAPSTGRSRWVGTPQPMTSCWTKDRTTTCSATARRAPGSSGEWLRTQRSGPCACLAVA